MLKGTPARKSGSGSNAAPVAKLPNELLGAGNGTRSRLVQEESAMKTTALLPLGFMLLLGIPSLLAQDSGPASDVQAIRALERSEEHTSELQSLAYLVCRLLLEKKKST